MNIGEWPRQWSRLDPEGTCMKCGELELSRRAFNLRINRLAHGLQELGIRKGDRVAVLMANSHVFLEILFALSKLGGILVPLNFRLAVPELEYILHDSEPSALIYSPEFTALVNGFRGRIPSIRCYIGEKEGAEDDLEYETWIEGRPVEEPGRGGRVDLDDPHIIMYTSGTTGRPKGAVITQGNTQWSAINYLHTYPIERTDVAACCAPLFHIGALCSSATPSLYAGSRLVIQRFFDPAGILGLIEENRVNSMLGIPVMFQFMSRVPEFESADFSTVKYFVTGGSPCPKSLIDVYQRKGVRFAQGYGMTEASIVTALLPEESHARAGSCGRSLFHVEIRIVDPEGKDLPPRETGEILIKGPVVMQGYWRRPEDTARSMLDGWLRSGDIGYLDEEGYLYIQDRKKDMYISGGENVYPAEVEEIILQCPGVSEVAVIGMPDDRWGETGLAVVISADNRDVTEDQIIEACRSRLAKYKIPRKVVFAGELPRTTSGKVLKNELRASYVPGA